MLASPATLGSLPQKGHYTPRASARVGVDDFDYVEEEWRVTGVTDDGDYETVALVRLPRDRSKFSGTVFVEPLHMLGFAPVWIYSAPYFMREGHGHVTVASQPETLDTHLRPHDGERYASLHIPAPDVPPLHEAGLPPDAEALALVWASIARRNTWCSTVLAQAGAAIRANEGPFEGVRHVILAGHSETGFVVTTYIREAHDTHRAPDGSAVYDGYFPSGYPSSPFRGIDVPLVQTISDADVSHPVITFTTGYDDRAYRRDDSDDAGDLFRLYELAGAPHSGTRYLPYNSNALWGAATKGAVTDTTLMSTFPHNELFNATLEHLVRWVVDGVAPPRAPRLELAEDGRVALDRHGNTRGGVRCAQMDVPTRRYFARAPLPSEDYFSVGIEVPFAADELLALYGDESGYRDAFLARIDQQQVDGWLLADDVDQMLTDLHVEMGRR
ncbi:hypothetical protein JOD63_000318 [Microbacterium terrae]|uniref:Alpha/beta hydrolase domain-containing protein n=1 Tax=Microbacterium terrae TaxID=69369 RepID=A0A0M2GV05_9MICO|nr:alpha/beta hydrolase domain-containing protein [Microbacterium terrae]KJL37521.1 hypothetical protein RS81_03278 [Microbacterium terrae]MBP1076350.1 hypothetical protein [Microbacterium terrae]GLJ97174.1 hypothetical protein GCM10017594_03710 [Microbacterium terrae]